MAFEKKMGWISQSPVLIIPLPPSPSPAYRMRVLRSEGLADFSLYQRASTAAAVSSKNFSMDKCV